MLKTRLKVLPCISCLESYCVHALGTDPRGSILAYLLRATEEELKHAIEEDYQKKEIHLILKTVAFS